MYTREIVPARENILDHGRATAGTWDAPFDSLNLLDIRTSKCKIPAWILNSRLKEWESFKIHGERFFLSMVFGTVKSYRLLSVFLFDRSTEERFHFTQFIPFGGRRPPQNLSNSSIDLRGSTVFFRVHNWLDAQHIRIDLDIEATRKRPPLTIHLEYVLEPDMQPLVLSLLFPSSLPMYAYKMVTRVRGDIVLGGRHSALNPDRTTGIVCDNKGYYPYRMRSTWCSSSGLDPEGHSFGFSLAENQATDTYKNNENALWYDKIRTVLPPVQITMPEGIEKNWIIQDLEGMVDLVFSPQQLVRSALNLFLSKFDYCAPFGVYNGFLVSASGIQIPIRNAPGWGEKLYMRI